MSCNCSYRDWRGELEWKTEVYGTATEEGKAEEREGGRKEGAYCSSTEKNT